MRYRRRRAEISVTDAAALAARFDALERRLDDLEDTAHAALAPDRIDELQARVDELTMAGATREELLEVRLHSARVAAEVARLSAELRDELARAAG